MNIWKNTNTLNGFDEGLKFTDDKDSADILLLGSKSIDLSSFRSVKGIFRAGIGKDNVPEAEAKKEILKLNIPQTVLRKSFSPETANFTCSLIFKMLYQNIGSVNKWFKQPRKEITSKKILIVGMGKIGSKVARLMDPFLKVLTFDIMKNDVGELKNLFVQADCISLHIPKNKNNISFIDSEKLSWMKDSSSLINTARGDIVDENALYEELKEENKSSF